MIVDVDLSETESSPRAARGSITSWSLPDENCRTPRSLGMATLAARLARPSSEPVDDTLVVTGGCEFVSIHTALKKWAEKVIDLSATSYGVSKDRLAFCGLDPELREPMQALPRWKAQVTSTAELCLQHGYHKIYVHCKSGRHRSVFMAEEMAVALRERGRNVVILHTTLGPSTAGRNFKGDRARVREAADNAAHHANLINLEVGVSGCLRAPGSSGPTMQVIPYLAPVASWVKGSLHDDIRAASTSQGPDTFSSLMLGTLRWEVDHTTPDTDGPEQPPFASHIPSRQKSRNQRRRDARSEARVPLRCSFTTARQEILRGEDVKGAEVSPCFLASNCYDKCSTQAGSQMSLLRSLAGGLDARGIIADAGLVTIAGDSAEQRLHICNNLGEDTTSPADFSFFKEEIDGLVRDLFHTQTPSKGGALYDFPIHRLHMDTAPGKIFRKHDKAFAKKRDCLDEIVEAANAKINMMHCAIQQATNPLVNLEHPSWPAIGEQTMAGRAKRTSRTKVEAKRRQGEAVGRFIRVASGEDVLLGEIIYDLLIEDINPQDQPTALKMSFFGRNALLNHLRYVGFVTTTRSSFLSLIREGGRACAWRDVLSLGPDAVKYDSHFARGLVMLIAQALAQRLGTVGTSFRELPILILYWYVISTHISAVTDLSEVESLFVGTGLSSGSVLVQLIQCIASSAIARRFKRTLIKLLALEDAVLRSQELLNAALEEILHKPRNSRADVRWEDNIKQLVELIAFEDGVYALRCIRLQAATNNPATKDSGYGESSLGDDVITAVPFSGGDQEAERAVRICDKLLVLTAGEVHHKYHTDGKGEYGRGPGKYYFLGRSLLSFHFTVRGVDDTLGSWFQPEVSASSLMHLWLRAIGLICDNVFSPAAYFLLIQLKELEDQLIRESQVDQEGKLAVELDSNSLTRGNYGLAQLLSECPTEDLVSDLFGASITQKVSWMLRLQCGEPRRLGPIDSELARELMGGWLGVPRNSRYLAPDIVDWLMSEYSKHLDEALPGVNKVYLSKREAFTVSSQGEEPRSEFCGQVSSCSSTPTLFPHEDAFDLT